MDRACPIALALLCLLLAAAGGCGDSEDQPAAPAQPAQQDPYRMDFRVAPTPGDAGAVCAITQAEADRCLALLASEGPLPGRRRGDRYQWFLHVENPARRWQSVVRGQWQGQEHILLCAQAQRVMLHRRHSDGSLAWRITQAMPAIQDDGNVAVEYQFNATGAQEFTRLMNRHLGGFYCVLLNDVAYPVVRINPQGGQGDWSTGRITNVGTRDDATRLAGFIMNIR